MLLSGAMLLLLAVLVSRGLIFAFPILSCYCLFAAAYAPFALQAGTTGDTISVVFRLAAALESVWRMTYWSTRPARVLLWAMAAFAIAAAIAPSITLHIDRTAARMLAQAAVTLLCCSIIAADRICPIPCPNIVRINLWIMTAWCCGRTAQSVAYMFYDSMSAWRTARLVHVCFQIAIVCAYVAWLRWEQRSEAFQ